MAKVDPEKAIEELSLLLIYLTRFEEKIYPEIKLAKAWKGYDFDVLNDLDDKNYIEQGSYRSKSIVITERGLETAQMLLNRYGISDWES